MVELGIAFALRREPPSSGRLEGDAMRRRDFLKWSVGLGVLGGIAEAAEQQPQLGACVSLGGKRLFPEDNPWNQDISGLPVDPRSSLLLASIGVDRPLHPDFGTQYQGAPIGIPYV